MTVDSSDAQADASLDWLPEEAQRVGAALHAVFAAYHRDEPPAELARKAAGFSADSPFVAVRSVARAYGLDSAVRRCTPSELATLTPPFVAFPDGRPVGVGSAGDRDGALTVGEPVDVVTFAPTREFLPEERALSNGSLLRRRMGIAKSGYWLAILAGVLLAIPGVIVSGLAKIFVNKYLVDGSTEWLDTVLIGLVLAAVLQVSLGWLQQSAITRVSRKLSISMSADYAWHLLRMPMSHFVSRPAGDNAFLLALNDGVASQLGRNLALAMMSGVIVLINGAFLFRYSSVLTVVVLVSSVVSFGLVRVMSNRLSPLKRDLITAQGLAMSTTTGGIASIESLKANGAEETLFARWAAHYERSLLLDQRISFIGIYMGAVPNLFILLMTAAVIGIGGAQVIAGSMSLGDLVGFQSLLFPFLFASTTVLGSVTLLQSVIADCRKLDETYRESIDVGTAAAESTRRRSAPRKLSGSLQLRGLSFGYEPGGPRLIDELSLRVEPGERVALVGGSGSGKSTVARLVTGQLEPWAGEILFDGLPRHEHPPAELSHSMAFVQQEIYLFDATVAENLTMWDPTVPESDYIHAAKDSCIHDEIMAFPGGYDARILEGGRNLSGGQRQRIEIARALTRNPRLLILDEATSALDSVTEAIVDANLRRRGCTCLIVAHRLSTIRDCDEIIVLDHGKVVERGTHESLMAAHGSYARLVGDMEQ